MSSYEPVLFGHRVSFHADTYQSLERMARDTEYLGCVLRFVFGFLYSSLSALWLIHLTTVSDIHGNNDASD